MLAQLVDFFGAEALKIIFIGGWSAPGLAFLVAVIWSAIRFLRSKTFAGRRRLLSALAVSLLALAVFYGLVFISMFGTTERLELMALLLVLGGPFLALGIIVLHWGMIKHPSATARGFPLESAQAHATQTQKTRVED